MNSRLPKQFWRVNVLDSSSLRTYDRASKTYADEQHAANAYHGFKSRGVAVEMWTTGPIEWIKMLDSPDED